MTISNGYTTLAVMRATLGITISTETGNDTAIELAVEAASRMIDDWCGRRFFTTSSDEVRYYKAAKSCVVYTDDILSVASLETDDFGDRTYSTAWETTDYDLMPLNAAPYTWIEVAPRGQQSFPTVNKGVKVTGKFGYCAIANVPPVVAQACIIQAARLFKRAKEAPFGVVGGSDMGQAAVIAKLDPDLETMLEPLRRIF